MLWRRKGCAQIHRGTMLPSNSSQEPLSWRSTNP
jgi:hypothetical protein